jgi:hypothetical protein
LGGFGRFEAAVFLDELQKEKAQNECVRRAPLKQGRNGLADGHCSFYFSAKLVF